MVYVVFQSLYCLLDFWFFIFYGDGTIITVITCWIIYREDLFNEQKIHKCNPVSKKCCLIPS